MAERVAVTGASGFIGGRLVEALAARGSEVTAIVRDYRRAARLGRLAIRIVRADMTDAAAVDHALRNADVVFHCAYSWAADDEVGRRENVAGSENVARAVAGRAGARLVHVSTMAIYGHDLPPVVDEETPARPGTSYAVTKLEVEHALRAIAAEAGLDLRVARATKVFGPYDFGFTVRTVKGLLDRSLWLIEDGSGIVSPSYVDNLVHGLLLVAGARDAGTYLIADGINITWRELYAPAGRADRRQAVRELSPPRRPFRSPRAAAAQRARVPRLHAFGQLLDCARRA